jgi:hypothetical protein
MGTMHAIGTQGLLQQRRCLAWSIRGTLLELILAAWTGSEVRNKSRKTWTYHQSKEVPKYFTLKTKWKKITKLACSRTKHYFRHQTAQLLTNSYFTKKMSNTGLVEKKPQQQQSPEFLLTLAFGTVFTLKWSLNPTIFYQCLCNWHTAGMRNRNLNLTMCKRVQTLWNSHYKLHICLFSISFFLQFWIASFSVKKTLANWIASI